MSAKVFTIVVAMFLAVAFSMFLFIDSLNGSFNEATGLVVDSESFPTYLQTHPAIESMPKSSSIGLAIGNNQYEIDGRDVYFIDERIDSDIQITLPQDYESVIGELGLCEAIRKASKENSLGVELHTNKATLFLKYRKLLKYSECLK